MHATIQSNVLRALARIMAAGDVRYYLMGVHVEVTEHEAFAVATDGHKQCAEQGTAIIPGDIVKSLKLAGRARPLDVKLHTDGQLAIRDTGFATVRCPPIDGRFPDWRTVIPEKVSDKCAQFNARYLATLQQAFDDLAEHTARTSMPVAVQHNGPNGAVMLRDNALAVIMPMRAEREIFSAKDWKAPRALAAVA